MCVRVCVFIWGCMYVHMCMCLYGGEVYVCTCIVCLYGERCICVCVCVCLYGREVYVCTYM